MLALGSGLLLILSFPKFGVGLTAWISLLPLLYALRGKNSLQGLLLGVTAGFTAHIGIMYWITCVVVEYGYLPYPVGIAAMLLLSLYLSVYTGLFAALLVFSRRRGLPFWVAAPVLWVVLEYGKSQLLTGFPWENLGYSQYLYLPVIQIADVAGVYGVSFLIVFVNAILYELFFVATEKRSKAARIIAVLAVPALVCTYGVFRLQELEAAVKTAPSLTARIAQGNIDQSVKWDPRYQRETIAAYADLSAPAPAAGSDRPELIVWPETAFPSFFQDINDLHRDVAGLARSAASWLLFGSPAYTYRGGELVLFNSAFLLAPDGTIAGRYDKVHLVPYGEYVPWRRFFPFINKLVAGIGDFGVGPGYHPLSLSDRRLGVLICYEGIFPEAARDYKRGGAEFLINITNDAWFGRTSAPYQHLSMTVFRAVENRLDVIRAANTGISALIDATGRIGERKELFQRGRLDVKIHFYGRDTFYATHGDLLVYLSFTAIIIYLLTINIRRFGHVGRNR